MGMEPANRIIDMLGGAHAVAKEVGREPPTVYRWRYPKERGGLDGNVPADLRPALIKMAKRLGKTLTHDDFYTNRGKGASK